MSLQICRQLFGQSVLNLRFDVNTRSVTSLKDRMIVSCDRPTNLTTLAPLATGGSSFRTWRKKGFLLVDKTELLPKLVSKWNVFLSRPRRFGKSLLLSMLKELYTNGTEQFAGLAVHSTWREDRCKVLLFDFFGLSDPRTFEADLCTRLRSAFFQAGFTWAHEVVPGCTNLSTLAFTSSDLLGDESVVVLIDEWDFPLSANLHERSAFELNRAVLSRFYAWLRTLPNVEFTLVAGIGRYENTFTISGQYINDISMDPQFAALLGYTQAELESNFAPYLPRAAARLKLSEAELLRQLKLRYDGFCFDYNISLSLYNPYSINSFFAQLGAETQGAEALGAESAEPEMYFPSFWLQSGNTPSILRTYLNKNAADFSLLDSVSHGIELAQKKFTQPATFDGVSYDSLLVQTGYYSIKSFAYKSPRDPFQHVFTCDFTNTEVRDMYASVVVGYLTQSHGDEPTSDIKDCATHAVQALVQHDIARFVQQLNYYLRHIHYDIWANAHEAHYRSMIALFFSIEIESYLVRQEVPNNAGRADLEVQLGDSLFVFELKLVAAPAKDGANKSKRKRRTTVSTAVTAAEDCAAGDNTAVLKLSHQAYDQIIAKGYGLGSAPKSVKHWYGIVLVIDAKARQVRLGRMFTTGQELGQTLEDALTIQKPQAGSR